NIPRRDANLPKDRRDGHALRFPARLGQPLPHPLRASILGPWETVKGVSVLFRTENGGGTRPFSEARSPAALRGRPSGRSCPHRCSPQARGLAGEGRCRNATVSQATRIAATGTRCNAGACLVRAERLRTPVARNLPRTACPAHRGDLSPWFSSPRRPAVSARRLEGLRSPQPTAAAVLGSNARAAPVGTGPASPSTSLA